MVRGTRPAVQTSNPAAGAVLDIRLGQPCPGYDVAGQFTRTARRVNSGRVAGSEVCGTVVNDPGKLTNRRGSADNRMDCSGGVPPAAGRDLTRSK